MPDPRTFGDKGAFIRPYTDMEKATDVFCRLFRGRTDAYALQQTDGSYRPVRKPLSREIIANHLSGEVTVGLYLITPVKNSCSMTVIDVDSHSKQMALKLIEACRRRGCQDSEYLLESSGSKGFHIWFFFDHPQPASTAMQLGKAVCHSAGLLGQVEIFPKQQHVPKGGFGNLIKLPGLHRKSSRFSRFFSPALEPFDFDVLDRILPVQSECFAATFASACQEPHPTGAASLDPNVRDPVGNELPCIVRMFKGVDEGRRNSSAFLLAVHMKQSGLPFDLVRVSLEAWNRRNRPPLAHGELHAIIRRAFRPQYPGFSCSSPDIQLFCNPQDCSRARRSKQ